MAKSIKEILMTPVDTDMSVEGFKRAFGMGKKKTKPEDMKKRITEKSYEGKNVTPDKKPAKAKKSYNPEPLPTGNIGAASGEIGPDMGKRKVEEDMSSRITEPGSTGVSRTAEKETWMDPHEQARKMMGFKKGGSVKGSSASRRGDGCAVRGKTRGKIY